MGMLITLQQFPVEDARKVFTCGACMNSLGVVLFNGPRLKYSYKSAIRHAVGMRKVEHWA